MKNIVHLIFIFLFFSTLASGINNYEYPALVLKFNTSISPTLNDGIVHTGIQTIDSLNVIYHANNFEYQDIPTSQYIRNILVMSFDKYVCKIDSILPLYLSAGNTLCQYIIILKEPIELSAPNEYLYAPTFIHPDDTMGEIENVQDDNYWGIYNFFYDPNPAHNPLNIYTVPQYTAFFPDMTFQDMGLHTHPLFPWQYKPHGHIGLWHLLPEYDDLVKAWDYTKGEGVTVINNETTYWGIHPDLINQWSTAFHSTPPNGIPRPPQDHDEWKNEYHATNIAGILVGQEENTQENTLSVRSSIGISPHAKLIGKNFNSTSLDDFINSHPAENIRVLSVSTVFYYDEDLTYLPYWEDWIRRYSQELNIVVAVARGYGDLDHRSLTAILGQEFEGVICVGDYNPDYKITTHFDDSSNNSNPDLYKVEINAPGWCVWTTSFTVNQDHTQIIPMLQPSTNTSSATPQVAGVCVLLASLYPWMTPAEIERQIKLGAHHLDDILLANANGNNPLIPNTPSDFFGAGCLDAYGSLFLHGDFTRNFTFQNEPNNTALIGTEFCFCKNHG